MELRYGLRKFFKLAIRNPSIYLLHPKPSLFFSGCLLLPWCFSTLVNYYFSVSSNLKVILYITKMIFFLSWHCSDSFPFIILSPCIVALAHSRLFQLLVTARVGRALDLKSGGPGFKSFTHTTRWCCSRLFANPPNLSSPVTTFNSSLSSF